ncbi:hypothetical protein STRDD10_00552 [Streptococcus sp. DD10]|uniref:hypothetical protein n=1 Tax=Streptococcus sp. DD10 TaxID=1777878 RepID=UPI000794617F|nr:hypothetical protein [Streptococcus sp. DD10]KXT74991.1 hypothetical protein STRDD10_00552 [Streptococcus sp. DD10]
MNSRGLIWARIWLGVAISAFVFYVYTMFYIFNHSMDEIFAPFAMFLVYAPLFPLFGMAVGGFALLACVGFAYQNLQRYK